MYEAFVALPRAIRWFRGEGSLRAFSIGIAINARPAADGSADQRVVFVLCEAEQRTSGEAGAIVGAPEGTVRTRLFHASASCVRSWRTSVTDDLLSSATEALRETPVDLDGAATRLCIRRSLEASYRGRRRLIGFLTGTGGLLAGTMSWAFVTGRAGAVWNAIVDPVPM